MRQTAPECWYTFIKSDQPKANASPGRPLYAVEVHTRSRECPRKKDEATNILAPLPTLHILEKQLESIAQRSHVRI